eukprot:486000-Amphidinium_carterae.1
MGRKGQVERSTQEEGTTRHITSASLCGMQWVCRTVLPYQHSKGQVQLAQDRGLLPDPTVETPSAASGVAGTAAASGAAAASTSTASGAARAVSGTESELLDTVASGTTSGSVPGTTSGSVPGVTSGSTPKSTRDSTIRRAERLEEEDQAAHKFVNLNDDEEGTISTLWGSERLSKFGAITDVAVTALMERNSVDYSNISPEYYYDLVDEDNGQPLGARKVAEGVHQEMRFLDEQRLGEPYLRKDMPERAVIWTARWVPRIKGDGVRSRYMARQFKNASAEADSEAYSATPSARGRSDLHGSRSIVAGTSEGISQLVGTELKVKENEAWSREAQVFLGANFSRLQIQMDGVTKDVIFEGSKPGYFKNTLIQAGMERGSAVGTAGVKIDMANDSEDEYIGDEHHRIYITRSRTKEESSSVDEALDEILTWKKRDSAGTYAGEGIEGRLICTIATSSAESEYYGACACAWEAVYVKELLKFIGEETHIQLELDASSAISMGNRVGLGKARHVAVRYLWLQQLVADKTIKLHSIQCHAVTSAGSRPRQYARCKI